MLRVIRGKIKHRLTNQKKQISTLHRVTILFSVFILVGVLLFGALHPPKAKASIAFDANLGQAYALGGSTVNTHTTTATAAAGSTIILGLRGYSGGTNNAALTVTGGGLTWSVDKTIYLTGGDKDNFFIASAYAPSGLASGSTITMTTDFGLLDVLTFASSFTGIASSNRVDQSNAQWSTSSSLSWNSGNVTTTNANDLLFGATFFDLSSTTFTPGAGFGEIHDYTSTGMSIESVYQVLNSTGTYAASGTADTQASGSRAQAAVAYKAAGGIQTKVGSFNVPASTGNKAITGVGFQPKAILLFADRRSSDGASSSNSQNSEMPMQILGMATSSLSRAVIGATDDFTQGNPFFDNTQALYVHSTSTTAFAADFVSMNADGFTLNFTTANATAYIVNYMALGGSDLSANITHITTPFVTGSQSTTGVGFKPDAMILIGGSTGDDNRGLGFTSGPSAQVTNSSNYNVGATTIGRYQRTNEAYSQINGNTIQVEAALTSFDTDGFTLNYTTVDGASNEMSALSLKGAEFKAGSLTQKTSTGTQATTGVGFQPVGLLTSTVLNTASSSVNNNYIVQAIGATDGSSQASVVTADNNNGNTSLDRTKIYKSLADDTTPTVQAAASLASFDNDGFTLNYTTADATAREIIYLAIGPTAGPNSAPAAPTLSFPINSATGVSVLPQLQMRTTDADSDYLQYKIEVCSTSNCSSVVRTIDQTSSQTGWSGQDQQSGTAYTGNSTIGSSTMATHTYQASALSPNTQYWWRAYAIDPGGSNTASSASSIFSFTTSQAPTAPTLVFPGASATGIASLPLFQLHTADADNDYLKYFIQLYDATACGGSQVGSNIDQTSSQTYWQGHKMLILARPYIGSSSVGSSSIGRYQVLRNNLLHQTIYIPGEQKPIDPRRIQYF